MFFFAHDTYMVRNKLNLQGFVELVRWLFSFILIDDIVDMMLLFNLVDGVFVVVKLINNNKSHVILHNFYTISKIFIIQLFSITKQIGKKTFFPYTLYVSRSTHTV